MTVQSCRLRERPAQRRFEDMKFGMFMHWGLYAIPGRGEWVKFTENIPHDAYKELRSQFNPTEYDADAWAQIMQEGGMKYVVITARHHDGFSMFDTRHGREWSIMNTPYAADPMKALAEACRKRGISLFFYYSLLDWTRPDYRSDFHHYLSFVNGQLAEL